MLTEPIEVAAVRTDGGLLFCERTNDPLEWSAIVMDHCTVDKMMLVYPNDIVVVMSLWAGGAVLMGGMTLTLQIPRDFYVAQGAQIVSGPYP